MNMLQTFAAVAAHQIRTPLAALGAQAELLLTDKTAAARANRIERLRVNASKLSRLANQLLGQAMVSYRGDTFTHGEINLVDLIRVVMNEAIPHSLERDIEVEFETSQPAIMIDGDPISLREGFSNLIDNAVSHGAKTRLHVSLLTDGALVRIRVADDGPGIAPDLWQSALIPFSVPRTEREGAGLGLSIVAQIARVHNGSLDFSFSSDGMFVVEMALPLNGNVGGSK